MIHPKFNMPINFGENTVVFPHPWGIHWLCEIRDAPFILQNAGVEKRLKLFAALRATIPVAIS
jgi:hypothetical protein